MSGAMPEEEWGYPETIRVGDVIPAVLDQARARGQEEGRKRATKAPTSQRATAIRPPTGRPTRLHSGLIDAICRKIEDGTPVEEAAIACGVGKSTYHRWNQRGREARQRADAVPGGNGRVDPKEAIFVEFWEATEAARAACMASFVQAHTRLAFGGEVLEIVEHFDTETEEVKGRTIRFTKPDRLALEWHLERSFPDLFGRTRLEVTGKDGGPIEADVISAREMVREKLMQAAQRMGIEPKAPEGEEQAS